MTARLAVHIREWDRHGRDVPGDAFAYWPGSTYRAGLPGTVAVFPKALGTATVTWPAGRDSPGNHSRQLRPEAPGSGLRHP
jgi:hypothetical protein